MASGWWLGITANRASVIPAPVPGSPFSKIAVGIQVGGFLYLRYAAIHPSVCKLFALAHGFHFSGSCRDIAHHLRWAYQRLFQEDNQERPFSRTICTFRGALQRGLCVHVIAAGETPKDVPTKSGGLTAHRDCRGSFCCACVLRPQRKRHLVSKTLPVPPGMPLAVIEGGVFGAKVVGHGIARRKPPAHLLDACLASLGNGVC